MKRKRERANDMVRTFHYNTRASSRKRLKMILDMLPMDIIIEIFKRLPAKTVARFLCMSKLWASIFRSPYFMKLFLAVSSDRPVGFFFSLRRCKDSFFFSSLQTQNPGEASLATSHRVYNKITNSSFVHGLICYKTPSNPELVVYNPSTRRSITLPKFKRRTFVIGYFLGYDPIDGVYKVLCMTRPFPRVLELESRPVPVFQVLTLGNGSSWKMIECSHAHWPRDSQICIGGVLYYEAKAAVMSFDVRSERFDLIKRPGDAQSLCKGYTMLRYEGKLAITSREISFDDILVLWVLKDAVKHEWLKMVFLLPSSWKSLAHGVHPRHSHRFVNVTDAGELIFAPINLPVPQPQYYVLCYDPRRDTVRKAEIEGITVPSHPLLSFHEHVPFPVFHVFSSQVESLMFL